MTQAAKVSGETFDHKLAAVFDTEDGATKSAEQVLRETSLSREQIFVVRPDDTQAGWELEPEDRGIWRTLIFSHLSLGVIGAVVGLCVFLALFLADVGFIVNNALASGVVLTALCATLGLLLAGLLTLRPDHMPYIVTAQSALRAGKTVLAIHASGREQLEEADRALNKLDVKTVSSL